MDAWADGGGWTFDESAYPTLTTSVDVKRSAKSKKKARAAEIFHVTEAQLLRPVQLKPGAASGKVVPPASTGPSTTPPTEDQRKPKRKAAAAEEPSTTSSPHQRPVVASDAGAAGTNDPAAPGKEGKLTKKQKQRLKQKLKHQAQQLQPQPPAQHQPATSTQHSTTQPSASSAPSPSAAPAVHPTEPTPCAAPPTKKQKKKQQQAAHTGPLATASSPQAPSPAPTAPAPAPHSCSSAPPGPTATTFAPTTATPTPPAASKLMQKMKARLQGGAFRHLNELLYTTSGAAAYEEMQADPSLFQQYHEGFQAQTKSWPMQPVQAAIKWLAPKAASWTVADFGCGDAQLAKSVPQTVHSLDLVATAPGVIACNMASTGLEGGSLDAAVFCLSLMGTDYGKFLEEAHRLLKPKGWLWIAEVRSRFAMDSDKDDLKPFIKSVTKLGFRLEKKDVSNAYFVILVFKKHATAGASAVPSWPALKACVYKKR